MMSLAWGSLADTTVDTYTQHTLWVKADGFNIGMKTSLNSFPLILIILDHKVFFSSDFHHLIFSPFYAHV